MSEDNKESKALVKRDPSPYPSRDEWGMMKEQSTLAFRTGFLPQSVKTPEQAMIIALKGRELGLGLMESFDSIYVVNGRPGYSAQLMLSRIFGKIPGAGIDYVESTDKACRIIAKRPNCKPMEFAFTLEDAVKAGLASKDNWKKYGRAMLRSRCIAEMTRAYFPDCLSGAYTPDELGDGSFVETEDGVVEVIEPQNTAKRPALKEVTLSGKEPEIIPNSVIEQFEASFPEAVQIADITHDESISEKGHDGSIDWSQYKIQYAKSKHSGKTLEKLGKGLLENYLKWLSNDSFWVKKNKDFPDEVRQDMEAIEFYLNSVKE